MFVEIKVLYVYLNKESEDKEIFNLNCINGIRKSNEGKLVYYVIEFNKCGIDVSEETGLKIIELLKENKMLVEV